MLLIKWHSLASEQQTDKRELKGVRDGERERERKYLPYFKRTKRPKWQDGSENKNSCESLILFCRGQYWTKNNKTISKRADNTQHTHTKKQ